MVFLGNTAVEISTAILERKLVSRMEHAAYLGRELLKAELALQTGRPYTQGSPLFAPWGPGANAPRADQKPTDE
jgi:hypothetical protein